MNKAAPCHVSLIAKNWVIKKVVSPNSKIQNNLSRVPYPPTPSCPTRSSNSVVVAVKLVARNSVDAARITDERGGECARWSPCTGGLAVSDSAHAVVPYTAATAAAIGLRRFKLGIRPDHMDPRGFLSRPSSCWIRFIEADGLGRCWGAAELLAGSISEGTTRGDPSRLDDARAAVILNAPTHACLTCCWRNTLCWRLS